VTNGSDINMRFSTLKGLFGHILVTKIINDKEFKKCSFKAFLKYSFFSFKLKKI
jgi:hypothetical protein